jgi:uncharacterized protein (DUF305 family)
MSKFLAISLIVVSLLAGIGIGYAVSPQYAAQAATSGHDTGLGDADRFVDLRYLNAMISHHGTAMKLAEQARDNSKRDEIISLAEEIIKNEPAAIEELYGWKRQWYDDDSKAPEKDVPNLGGYDEKFDLRFLNALIAHHKEGIKMANEISLKSSRLEILNNADAVRSFLEGGVEMLDQWRSDWYTGD